MNPRPFGNLPSGEAVTLYRLENSSGFAAEILSYGGILRSLQVPDKSGNIADVVLGFSALDPYLAGQPYFGAITGRIAGRLRDGTFSSIGDESVLLACNDGRNHLHGGHTGLDKRNWQAQRDANGQSLTLRYHSPDGEEGYPGAIDFTVRYTVTDQNELIIDSHALSDQATPVNLTHHSYFNLGGEETGNAIDHHLQIAASQYIPTDDDMTLQDTATTVQDRDHDFRKPRHIANALPGILHQHGDLYILAPNATPDQPRFAAELFDPTSGRRMTVSTTDACFQFYSGRFLDGSLTGKSGQAYQAHAGVCMECQGHPNPGQALDLPSIMLEPDIPTQHRTVYAFSTH